MRPDATREKPAWRLSAILLRTLRVCTYFVVALTAGYLAFAYCVTVMPAGALRPADGIVALTGDEDRIAEAIRLLAKGQAGRLLISGVNKSTRAPQLIGLNGNGRGNARLFRCCVDLDRRALNTEDNAIETTLWVRKRHFRSLIVVTSNYHMPRALLELRQAMPEVDLVPYPVKAPRLDAHWWGNARTAWVLGKEYLKFVLAAARYAANMFADEPGKTENRSRTVNARLS